MTFTLIATVGPNFINNPEVLKSIHSLGPIIYRLNGAHTNESQIRIVMELMKGLQPKAELMIDLPGNKIRTANLDAPICFKKDEVFVLSQEQLNFPEFVDFLKTGDTITANDSKHHFAITHLEGKKIGMKSTSSGHLQNGKGLHLQGRHPQLPFFFARDLELIKLASVLDIDYLSLSFVRDVADIELAKKTLRDLDNTRTKFIAKIETAAAFKNVHEILQHIDIINIDRGDLSADIGLMNLPLAQDQIVDAALAAGKRVFLATQFLKNMETNPLPVIAEMNDLYRTVKRGISGIQLSEETAVGEYPVDCVKLVFDIHRLFGA